MSFQLTELAERTVADEGTFVCRGGREACDRKCVIRRIGVQGHVYPFGGACNKYYNQLRHQGEADVNRLDLVALKERLTFITYGREWGASLPADGKTVGICRSLMVNALFPLYHGFFRHLGYRVLLGETVDAAGCEQRGAAFCYPVEQAHGMVKSLLDQGPDYLFIPHVKAMPVPGGGQTSVTCPFVQAEPYTLSAAFPQLRSEKLLKPVLELTSGYEGARRALVELAAALGHTADEGQKAFNFGLGPSGPFRAHWQRPARPFWQTWRLTPRKRRW